MGAQATPTEKMVTPGDGWTAETGEISSGFKRRKSTAACTRLQNKSMRSLAHLVTAPPSLGLERRRTIGRLSPQSRNCDPVLFVCKRQKVDFTLG